MVKKHKMFPWKMLLFSIVGFLSIFISLTQPVIAADSVGDNGGGGASRDHSPDSDRTTTTFDIAGEAQSQGAPGTQNLGSADGGFGTWVSSLLRVVMLAGVLVTLVFLIIGAFEWITSAGDKGKLEAARSKITNAVIGMIVLAAVTAILALVQNFLGVDFINF